MGTPDRLKSLRRRHVKGCSTPDDDASVLSQPPSYRFKLNLRENTRARRIFALTAAFAYLISFIFLVLVELGNTHAGSAILGDIYFFKLSLTDIIPESVPNAELINSIARGLGLHDFYQPGLWNYCEGYQDEGVTLCSKPQAYYWFDIVSIILNELLSGATIALPLTIIEILNILKICSHIMFAFFLAGTILVFVLVFLSPVTIFTRWWSLPLSFVSAVTLVLILTASTIASVISFFFKYAATIQTTLHIQASVGIKMLVFTWIATGCALVGFVLHAGMGCCCTSRRDLKTGMKAIRHSSMHRAMSRNRSQRSMSQCSGSRSVTTLAGDAQARNRSKSVLSSEQIEGSRDRSRSGTLLSTHEVEQIEEYLGAAADRANSQNSSTASRSNTVKSGLSRSNTLKSSRAGAGRARSNI